MIIACKGVQFSPLLLSYYGVNFKTKGRFDILKIREFEAEMLRKNGFDYLIINGHNTYNNIFLTEDVRALKFLENFRQEIRKKK
jgi:hypothetical protein